MMHSGDNEKGTSRNRISVRGELVEPRSHSVDSIHYNHALRQAQGERRVYGSSQKARSSTGAPFEAFLLGKARQCLRFMFLCLCIATAAHAQVPTPAMPPMSPELELRLKQLETELRCLVCQNQTLAESPAGLAGDLRREIRLLADQNKSNEEIKEHLRARYGDFVLYRPPLDAKNYLLWFGPFGLLFGGAILLWIMNRRRAASVRKTPAAPVSADVLARASSMLKDD